MHKNEDEKSKNLEYLRRQIRETDAEMLRLAAKRMSLCREVGVFKKENKLPVKDFKVEKEVIERGRRHAESVGIYKELAEDLLKSLIRYSVQEQNLLFSSRKDTNLRQRKILVIGGSGLMGQWFCHFFASFGFEVTVLDRVKFNNCPYPFHTQTTIELLNAEFILFATPLSLTANIMRDIIDKKPRGILIDICSLKTPVLDSLEYAKSKDVRTVSIHPMFGPDVEMLSGRNIIICEDQNKEDISIVEGIFQQTSARILRMPLRRHDMLISHVLGSAHLVNLVFAGILAQSKISFTEFEKVAGTTFQKQIQVAKDVIGENQDLYYEIQGLNVETFKLFQSFDAMLKSYRQSLLNSDRVAFKAEMERARQYFYRL